MAAIHISGVEAERDFAAVLARARAGDEFVIVDDTAPPVMLRVCSDPFTRRLSESLRRATDHGTRATLDGKFSQDLDAAVASHSESLDTSWG